MKSQGYIRFRCSGYPRCKTFLKSEDVEFESLWDGNLSAEINFRNFLSKVDNYRICDTLWLANQEATRAGRMVLKDKSMPDRKRQEILTYVELLSDFIRFFRSKTKIRRSRNQPKRLYWKYWQDHQIEIRQQINSQ
jgi:hypothetical protein